MGIQFHQFRKKKQWVVTWRNPWTGKKHTQSFADEAAAMAFEAAQAEIAARERALLRKARKQTAGRSRINVKDLLDSYFRLAHTNPLTIRQARYHAGQIIYAFGHRLASQISRQDMLNFSEAQQLRGIAQITVNRRVSILRAALNWAVRNGLLPANPLHDLRLPRARAQRIAPPTAKEARAILEVAAPHVQRVVILGLCAGPRIGPSELFRLEWRDVDLGTAMLRMPSARKNHLEDGRDIPIRSDLLRILQAWQRHDAALGIRHVISWGGRPVRSICRAWHTALERANIKRRIRPYDLRHAFATYALAGSADIGSVASLMGHVDASMILNTYQHVQDNQKRAAVEAAPDILGLAGAARAKRLPGM
ncbi:site-specific integrase [Desulfovibrio sp. ZJ369]|uniref:tyrosine-type recombinase/integrase n=1 Tax=Desulfovibrio sp. ZJ369 TaxID=2709793 RepID=UPI0013EC33C8|nr:site-specific integrase [Desulfovibrio sp. ZJ369]